MAVSEKSAVQIQRKIIQAMNVFFEQIQRQIEMYLKRDCVGIKHDLT